MYSLSEERGSYHHDYTLNAIRKGLITTFFPVVSGLRFFPQHHGRAVGEEVHWCGCWSVIRWQALEK